jgi:MFS family permease
MKQQPLWTRDFILISLANFCVFMGLHMLMPVIPVYTIELGGSETWAGFIAGGFTLSVVLIRPLVGNLLDRQGRKGVYLIGILFFLLCTLAYHWVPSILTLLALRFLHGFGWGTSSTGASTIATDIIPKARMGEGMGYFGLTGTLSMAIAPALGLGLMDGYGFNSVFTGAVFFALVAFFIALPINCMKIEPNARSVKSSIIEKAALTPGMIALFLTITYGSIITFIALYGAERQVENIGLFFSAYALSLLFCRPYFGRLADRKGYAAAVLPGILAVFLAIVILYLAHSLLAFMIAGFIYGIGFGGTQPALQAMAVRDVDPSRHGAANATFFLGFDFGIGIGSIAWGLLADIFGYQYIYLLALIPTFIALILFLKASRQVSQKVTH